MNGLHDKFSQNDDQNDPRLAIIATVILSGVVTALALYLFGNLLGRLFPVVEPPCNDDNPCGLGLECVQGTCRKPVGKLICGPADPADTCFCPDSYEVSNNLCRVRPLQPSTCGAEAFELIAALNKAHEDCKAKLKDGDAMSCQPVNFLEFMLENGQFHKILNTFPHTAWVLFPKNRPRLDGSWPSPAIRSYYSRTLNDDAEAFAQANYVLLIAQASSEGDATNTALLQERLRVAGKFLDDVRRKHRGAWSPKLMGFPAPAGSPVRLDNFVAQNPGDKSPSVHLVGWSADSQTRYNRLFDAYRNSQPITEHEYKELEEFLNDAVAIVPIFCADPSATK